MRVKIFKNLFLILIFFTFFLIYSCTLNKPILTEFQTIDLECGFDKIFIGYYSGALYISYIDSINNEIKFAKSTDNGYSWLTMAIDKCMVMFYVVSLYNLDFELYNGHIYLLYFDSNIEKLKIAKSVDGGLSWSIKILDQFEYSGKIMYGSMKVVGNTIYISCSNSKNPDLIFLKSEDGGENWVETVIDSEGYVGEYNSMAVDGNNIYISYYDSSNSNLKLAKSNDSGETWSIDTIDNEGDVGRTTSIIADKSYIFIIYYDFSNGLIKLAKSTNYGESWSIKQICDGEHHFSFVKNGGNIYMSYVAENSEDCSNDLKLAKSKDLGNSWYFDSIASIGDIGEYNSIVVNGTYIYIAYFDSSNEDLKFVKSDNGGISWR
ncbi:MAG: glycoside hydrolase [Exilispira sp.]|jgi:hypothetical protein|nr:glycoside hydrolase [Exilispira sp.]